MNEPGLYRLIGRSTMDKAEAFQDWVYEVVLPSIRKTVSYSMQAAAPPAKQGDEWHSKRLEGKELMQLKNASLQQLIAGGFGQAEIRFTNQTNQNLTRFHCTFEAMKLV